MVKECELKSIKASRCDSLGAAYGEQDVKIAMEGKELKQIEDFLYLLSISTQFLVKIVHTNKVFYLQRRYG